MGPQDPGSDPLAPQTEKNLTGPSRIQSLGNTVFENLRRNPVFFPVSRGRIWSPWKASLILNARGKALIQGGGSNINLPPSTLAAEIFDLLDFYDIDFFSYARLIGLEKEKGQITCGIVSIKEGIRKIRAKLFIDATGDGDAAALADCPFMKGRASDGKVQSSTLIFIIGDIDIARMPAYMEIRKIWKSKIRQVPINHSVFQFVPHGENTNEIAINMTHAVNANPLTSAGLTRMRRQCIRQAEYLLEFFRTEIPGFEHAWISQIAPQKYRFFETKPAASDLPKPWYCP